nr:reverse transcriptase domain-containing protein [Tanacetum cinerariifolium]
ALTKEIKEMKDVFEELEVEVDQNVVDRKHDEIERKNLLIENDNLIAECLSKEVFYIAMNSELNVSRFTEMHVAHTIIEARCLELKAELSNLCDKIHNDNHNELVNRFSNLEQISYLQEIRSEAVRTLDFRALDSQITQLTKKVTVLQEHNDLFRGENRKIKQHYKELYDSIKITCAKHIEKVTALTTKNVNLKAQILKNVNSVIKDHVKPTVLVPGVNRCTDASGSQPRSNTKKNRVSPAKGVNMMKVEEYPRTNKSHLRTMNFVDSSSHSKRTGDYVIGDSVISRVYYVEGLGHNLFSVRQFCDSDLEVAFRKHSCYVRDTDGVELIKGSRGFNLYTISVEDTMKSSSICLLSKASKNKSGLVLNAVPAAPYVPPTNEDLEILFQPMFDEYLEPLRVVRPVSPAPAVQVSINSAAESTLIEDNPVAPVDNNPFINVFVVKPSSDASSSGDCMRTRNSYFPNNSSVTILRSRNKRRTPNVVEPELRIIVEVTSMADNRTMEEHSKHPWKGEFKNEIQNTMKTQQIVLMEQQNAFQNNLQNMLSGFFQNQASTSGTLPINTIPNPKGEMKAITTQSGVAYKGPSIPTPKKVVKRETEKTTDKEETNFQGSTAHIQPPVTPIPEPDVSKTLPKPNIPYPSRHNDQKLHEKATNQMEKFFQIFQDLHFDISFADALFLMPKFASTIKSLLTNKDKLFELAKIHLNENCSAMLLKKLPKKLGDPGKFLIPCDFPGMDVCHAMADLGASINLMPLSIWKKLSLPKLTPTRMTIELANRSITHPKGVTEDVFVKVGKFYFLTDFVVVDFEADPRVPLILGRSFLRTGRALIDVYGEEITLRVNDEAVTFNLNQTTRYSSTYDDLSVNRIDIIDVAREEYAQEILGLSNNSSGGNPTSTFEPIISDSHLKIFSRKLKTRWIDPKFLKTLVFGVLSWFTQAS